MLYGVIIAGGTGKRLWPKSRICFPKYLLRINGRKSLLQQTVDRARQLIPIDNILIITNREHLKIISREIPKLPKKNIIAEPVSRNTAPCVCVAASLVKKRDPDGVILVMPADHIIEDKESIKEIFSFAVLIARMKECLLTIGLKPGYPATGYGYIKTGKLYKRLLAPLEIKCKHGRSYKFLTGLAAKKLESYKIDRFIEKPPLKKARAFLKSRRYLWNSGIFIGRAQTFLDEFKRCKPAIYRIAEKIGKSIGTGKHSDIINRYYKEFPDISIDYAIMEKTKIAYVIKADISWQDIGSWQSLEGHLKKDSRGNIVMGDYLGMDLENSIIVGEKGHLIAALGLDNVVIVHTKDSTLVCAKDRAEHVKELVDLAQNRGLKRYL